MVEVRRKRKSSAGNFLASGRCVMSLETINDSYGHRREVQGGRRHNLIASLGGDLIVNHGEARVPMQTRWDLRIMTFQIAGPLAPAGRITAKGHHIGLSDENTHVHRAPAHVGGWLHKIGNVLVMLVKLMPSSWHHSSVGFRKAGGLVAISSWTSVRAKAIDEEEGEHLFARRRLKGIVGAAREERVGTPRVGIPAWKNHQYNAEEKRLTLHGGLMLKREHGARAARDELRAGMGTLSKCSATCRTGHGAHSVPPGQPAR